MTEILKELGLNDVGIEMMQWELQKKKYTVQKIENKIYFVLNGMAVIVQKTVDENGRHHSSEAYHSSKDGDVLNFLA